jgi:nitrite reductase/ring-hydroxylating ferredoxin subunit/uncharacterized membrane protein
MQRKAVRLIGAQEAWARPVGEFGQRIFTRVFDACRPVKDVLNGVWFGHPVHPALTDVPIGAMTAAMLLDVAGQRKAADLAVATGVAGMVASAATGVADAVDAYGEPLVQATVHATVMTTSLTLSLASLAVRVAFPQARGAAIALNALGYATLVAGAYVGGELVFGSGNMVDRHAWDEPETKWTALEVGAIPEDKPVRGTAAGRQLVVVRRGGTVYALDAVCAHAGGPLPKGKLVDGCIQCPWHGSRFRLDDGHVVRGPAVYDQPAYEVRGVDGAFEVRLRTTT